MSTSRLQRLYEEMILDHNKNPKNFRMMEEHSHHSHGKNPLCGDDFEVFLTIENNTISDISFHGTGCAISKSSGSLMTQTLKGKSLDEVKEIKDLFLKLVSTDCSNDEKKKLGKLKVFEGVKNFPVRVKCAALVWRTVEDALEKQSGEISTE